MKIFSFAVVPLYFIQTLSCLPLLCMNTWLLLHYSRLAWNDIKGYHIIEKAWLEIFKGCRGQAKYLEANVKFDWQLVDDGDRRGITCSLHLVPVRIPAAPFGTSCSLLIVCSGRLAKRALQWFKLNETKARSNTSVSERASYWHGWVVFLE